MIEALFLLVSVIRSSLTNQTELALENLALRQQLAILNRKRSRPSLRRRDRLFWFCLSAIWQKWRKSLIVVKPETVVRWHRKGFALYWKRLSNRKGVGRPGTGKDIRDLVRKMANANPTWGSPRVHGELQKLGIKISERTVARLMPRKRKPPSQTWRTFLDNHVKDFVSIDFFVAPTVTFRILFVLVILAHDRRRVVHYNVTEHPTAYWTGEQIIQAFPGGSEPRYLLRDRDSIYGQDFRERIRAMGIEEIRTAPQSPWQNTFCERLIGSVRQDCLNHVIILGESHLRRILARYFRYYNKYRTHLSLAKDAPEPRSIQKSELGKVIEIPEVGGLHHHYERRAA
jgi:transposase InsO family protein